MAYKTQIQCYYCNKVGHEYANCFFKWLINPYFESTLIKEMWNLYKKLLPNHEDEVKRKTFVKKIEKILNFEHPNSEIKVDMFGSSITCLGTSTSDVDICITTPNKKLEDIHTLSEKLQKYEIKVLKCVHKAKVPIVKFLNPILELACNININYAQAVHNTNLIKSYVCLDSRVHPLVMIIKHWAQRRDLNDATRRTLSSYTWTCMVLNFLQMRYPPISPVLKINRKGNQKELLKFECKNNESIGGLLFAFLNEEPFNTKRNLENGVNNDRFKIIIQEFRRAAKYLYKADLEICCEIYDEWEFEYCDGIPVITLKILRKVS
ncbi:pap 25a associated domain family [Gigaspora margarita]|uniref:Pap 25a associated domain family n=1 Tax=Gigaspora margarita TaxID=4874 RepID=A0A8H4EGP5_GIGMA|nr:pap 25a associated domain family [Gigaspora margarita]